MNEEWRAVVGWEGKYEVSNYGCVRSKNGLMRLASTAKGYLRVTMGKANKMTRMVHRLVDAAFNGPIPPGLEINHKDGVKTNNRLDNLERVTHSENVKHAYALRLRAVPGREPKVSDEQILDIKRLAAAEGGSGHVRQQLADRFGVTRGHVNDILSGRSRTRLYRLEAKR